MKASQFSTLKRANSAKINILEPLRQDEKNTANQMQVQQNNFMKTGFSYKSQQQRTSTSQTQRTKLLPRHNSAVTVLSKNLPPVLNFKNIVNINNAEPIQVVPTEIIFKEIKQNQTYETFVIIQSLSKQLNRIKIIQPTTVRFRVDYDQQGKIAAGLSMKLLVTFETNILEDFHDKFILQYQNEGQLKSIEVPLHALRPQASILFEPFINYGFIKIFENNIKTIMFKNEGKMAGKVRLKYDSMPEITCDPQNFTILPGQELPVKVNLNSKESGIFRGKIEVVNEGQSLLKYIDVNATPVEFNKFLIDDQGNSTSTFDFEETYFGEKKVIKGFLVNNTPYEQKFKVNMRIGFHSDSDEKVTLQTPIEVGMEQTEQIMKCMPERGFVKAYSQIPIQFICHSKVKYEHQIITKNYALSDQELVKRKESEEDYTYSAIFEFDGQDKKEDILPITLIGRGLCPKIKINKALLNFGECQAHDHREAMFLVENKHNQMPVDIKIPRIPSFSVDPIGATINPGVKSSFIATFQPSTVGKYKTNIYITLINDQYKIPIQVIGESNNFLDSKFPKTRGPESLPQDFKLQSNFIDDQNPTKTLIGTTSKKLGMNESSSIITMPKGIDEMEINFDKLEEIKTIKENKQKYVEMLRDNRQSRVLKEKEKIVKLRLDQMEAKLKEKGLTLFQDQDDDENEEKDPRKTVPLDVEFELGMMETKVFPPGEMLSTQKDPLFVSKPIGKYEPMRDEQARFFNPDPNIPMRKPFPEVAKTHKEIRDVRMELTGEMLQKISIGPKIIDFGPVYVESKVVKRFCVKNDLRSSIKVQLTASAPELAGTYQKPQIIPSSDTARFDVELYSTNLNDNYTQTIKYTINDRHQFEFQVKAKIEKVKLELSKTQIKFQFADDSTNMETFETLQIKNNGNAEGHYKWDTSSKVFILHPPSGIVPPNGGVVDTVITYRPSPLSILKENQQGGLRQESDKLVIHVTNGIEQSVKCEGLVNEAKCIIRQQSIDLGQLIVSKEETRVFQIKNTSRIPAVFRVLTEKLPENCIVTPVIGKIQPDGQIECSVKYSCREERDIKTEIQVLIRGGKILKLPFSVQTVIPNVLIKEEVFNFGQLTKDNAGHLEMSLINRSEIPAELILDMRTEEENPDCPDGIGCLQITPLDEGDESILKSVHQDFIDEDDEEKRNENSDMDLDPDDQSIQSDESLIQASPNKKYNITIKPNQTLRFQLTFTPNDAKPYNFELPITLARFGALPGLIRNIICRGIKSQFLVQPQNIEFPRKIITTSDKDYPENFEVTLSNPERKAVNWRIDATPFDKGKKLFSIHPTQGRIEPGQNQIIKASFDPKEPGEYEEVICLFLDGDEGQSSIPVHKIQVKGVAAFPKLMFDRREVLLPVVPLGIESKCIFRIINDGYENLKIKHQVLEELGNIKVDCRFPEGKNLNVSKNKLKVEVYFSSKKPISFTTHIEFKDDKNKGYVIPVSGTTDNSLFTIFPYMQRCKGEYKTEIDPNKNSIMLLEEDAQDDQSDITTNNNISNIKKKYSASVASAKTHSSRASIRSTRSALGYSPVPKEMFEHSKDQIKNWLNFTVLQNNIQNFPDSIVEDSGDQLYELLQFLVGSKSPLMETKAVFEGALNRTERSLLLYQQYDSLIRLLKQDGALLNHVRPQFLLGYNEYHAYIKTLSKEDAQAIHPNGLKISSHKYSYFQSDAWITLFYQIIKIYYLSRISIKNLKAIPNIHPDKAVTPDYYLNGSNIYSQSEGVLLRWLELNHEIINPHQPLRITSFDKELASGHLIANLIKNYVGNEATAFLSQMKPVTNTDDENFFNCDKVHHALQDINLQTPFNAVDLSKASQRETVLFLIQLFNSLPNYIPKGQPIIFSCVLGEEVTKTIELTNPSNKTIHYWVKRTGCTDFQIETNEADTIKLDPKSVYKFKVKFVSRVSQPVYGRIRFTNRRESNVAAAALVFDFKSNITGRVSSKIIDIDCPLYQKKEFTVKVENKFLSQSHGEFSVNIVHEFETKEKKDTEPNVKTKDKNAKQIQKKTQKPEELVPLETLNAVPCFFLKQADTMVIKKNNFSHLNLVFIPLLYEAQKCYIIFSDPTVGEFQYEVIGAVTLPEEVIQIPETPIQPPIYVEEQRNWPIKIPFKNEAMREARKNVEYYMSLKKKKDFDPKKYTLPNISPDIINFYVDIEQPHQNIVTTSKTILLENPIRASKRKQEASKLDQSFDSKRMDGLSMISSIAPTNIQKSQLVNETLQEVEGVEKNSMYLNFNFKIPFKEYTANITLRNPEKYDIRRYKLVVTSLPKPVKAALEFTAAAKETVVQEIPVVNTTDKDWMIKINLIPNEEMNGRCFFVGNKAALSVGEQSVRSQMSSNLNPNLQQIQSIRDVLVKKKGTANIPVQFTPLWICLAEAKLIMTNPVTNDVFEYELKGIGEEPLAVDHLVINCQARQTTKQELVIKNPNTDKSVTYEVETDLVGASGPSQLTIGPNKKAVYQLLITPLLSGQYTGSITFTDTSTGEYTWWTALLNTESPPCQKKIDMITTLRKAIAFDIEITNPSNETANFEVFIEGDGLVGVPYMQIPPKSSQMYELFFLPLKVGKQQGSIAFVSDHLGEIWYELNLVAEDSQIIRLPMLKAELGKVEQHEIRLDNPSNEDVKVYTYVSNPSNFDVLPEQIVIPANDEISVYIRYMPSVLDSTQTSEIKFQTETIGRWDYLAFGMGIPPTQFEPKIVTIGLNKDFSSVILFKNPFKDQIQVNILLESEDDSVKDVLQLLTKKSGKDDNIYVPGLGVIQIPFSFTPREIRCYECKIIVSMNDKIQWKYPIQAITESYSTGILSTFKTKCRVFYENEFKIQLPGITDVFGERDTFEYEIKNLPPKLESVITKSFQVRMTKNTLSNKSDYLTFVGRFHPMKPFKTNIDFIIHRKMGGLWKFKITLESSPPNEDDIIVLSAPLDTVDTVSFRLTNRFKTFATFSAKFTPESDPEFAVTPSTGILEPYGRDGTLFTISFSPVEYGKAKAGKLIIETDEMFWSYQIKGVLPKYDPPVIAASKINNKLGIDVTTNWKHQKKNYLADNIKKTKENKISVANKDSQIALMSKTFGNTTFMKKSMLSPNERQSILDGKSIVSNKNSRNPNLSIISNRFFKN
ncbi:hypothetical protein ABPG72_002207 [Tetrahymena utriculariae]